jgi:hypothetical protein
MGTEARARLLASRADPVMEKLVEHKAYLARVGIDGPQLVGKLNPAAPSIFAHRSRPLMTGVWA